MAGFFMRILLGGVTAACLSAAASAEPVYCGNGLWYPDGVCPSAPPPAPPVPQGPTPAQKEQMRQQALADANEAGISAYRRGDYATALREFERALEYSPYNPTIKHNIERARQKLAEQNAPAPAPAMPATGNSAWGQLNAVAKNSGEAVAASSSQYSANVGGTGAPNQARGGFDSAAAAPSIPQKFTKYLSEDADPVVPLRFRTPKIRRLEDQRDAARAEAVKLERQRTALAADLAPARQPPQAARPQQIAEQKKAQQQQVAKQETAQLKKVQHLDFSIRKELDAK